MRVALVTNSIIDQFRVISNSQPLQLRAGAFEVAIQARWRLKPEAKSQQLSSAELQDLVHRALTVALQVERHVAKSERLEDLCKRLGHFHGECAVHFFA